jgi:pimeloyl-ACP methyl ester carboxylesterase
MRRVAAAVLIVVLLGWLALPILRAYILVAARPSDPRAPSDLIVVDMTTPHGVSFWLVGASANAPAVVLVHGFKGNREEMLPWARFIHDAGYNVALFDARGCGKSAGAVVGLGATEPQDITEVIAAARGIFHTDRIGLLGISLGAGAAILAAAADPAISAVVADSAWTDQDLLLSRLSFVPLGPVRIPLPPYGIAAVNAMVGADVSRARPLDVISAIAPRPILLIHSADDDNGTTPVEGARQLFAAAGEPKELWIAPRGGHAGAINAFPEEYRARVLAFLRQALP